MRPTEGMTIRIELRRRLPSHFTETFAPTMIMVVVRSVPPPCSQAELQEGRGLLAYVLLITWPGSCCNWTQTCTLVYRLFAWDGTIFLSGFSQSYLEKTG